MATEQWWWWWSPSREHPRDAPPVVNLEKSVSRASFIARRFKETFPSVFCPPLSEKVLKKGLKKRKRKERIF